MNIMNITFYQNTLNVRHQCFFVHILCTHTFIILHCTKIFIKALFGVNNKDMVRNDIKNGLQRLKFVQSATF